MRAAGPSRSTGKAGAGTEPALDPRVLLAALDQEIGAPVGGMIALGELLQRQPLSLDGAACLGALLDQGRQLQALLADVRAHLNGAVGPTDLRPEPLSPAELLDDLSVGWRKLAEHRRARLVVVSRCESDLLVECDASRLRQVLAALAGEALCACDEGAIEVQMSATPDGDIVRLAVTVCDTGLRPRGGGDLPATLTLTMARHTVAAMGGALHTAANPGRGVTRTLELTLPRAQASPAGVEIAPAQVQAPIGHVLIVDDNVTNRTVAEALCGMFGFTSETAEDGQAAVEAVGLRDFDLILMDIRMPRMDGVEATRRIRALPGCGAVTPILALTANADADSIRDYLAAGMDDVVEKPIKPDHLLAAIQRALGEASEESVAEAVQPLFALQG